MAREPSFLRRLASPPGRAGLVLQPSTRPLLPPGEERPATATAQAARIDPPRPDAPPAPAPRPRAAARPPAADPARQDPDIPAPETFASPDPSSPAPARRKPPSAPAVRAFEAPAPPPALQAPVWPTAEPPPAERLSRARRLIEARLPVRMSAADITAAPAEPGPDAAPRDSTPSEIQPDRTPPPPRPAAAAEPAPAPARRRQVGEMAAQDLALSIEGPAPQPAPRASPALSTGRDPEPVVRIGVLEVRSSPAAPAPRPPPVQASPPPASAPQRPGYAWRTGLPSS